jgi:hypothetical protein
VYSLLDVWLHFGVWKRKEKKPGIRYPDAAVHFVVLEVVCRQTRWVVVVV